MGTFTTPAQLMARQKARFAGVKLSMTQATHELALGGKADFLSQTVGALSEKQLRQIGHPYARTARVLGIQKLNGYRGLQTSEAVLTKDGTLKRTKSGALARRKGAQITKGGRVSDLPINRQTGKLRAAIQLIGTRQGRQYDLYSAVPYAKHVLSLTGTKHMRHRGLLGPQGLLRKRHRARHAGIVNGVRMANRKP